MTAGPPRGGPRRRGLGRGLEALLGPALPDDGDAGSAETLAQIEVGLIDPNPEQPRRSFDEVELAALAGSIRTHGLLHPIVVERTGLRYRLVAGERRLRATRLAGLTRIAAVVRPAADSARASLETALTENLLRADLSPLEEAAAYARLADAFALSHEEIALRLGRSRPAVSNTIRLLALPAPVQVAVAEGALSAGHARALLGLPDEASQEEYAARAVAEGWSVRQTERAVQASLGSARRRGTPSPPRLEPDDQALVRALERALGLPVALERRRRGGRLTVSFADDQDLDALYRRLGGPDL